MQTRLSQVNGEINSIKANKSLFTDPQYYNGYCETPVWVSPKDGYMPRCINFEMCGFYCRNINK